MWYEYDSEVWMGLGNNFAYEIACIQVCYNASLLLVYVEPRSTKF